VGIRGATKGRGVCECGQWVSILTPDRYPRQGRAERQMQHGEIHSGSSRSCQRKVLCQHASVCSDLTKHTLCGQHVQWTRTDHSHLVAAPRLLLPPPVARARLLRAAEGPVRNGRCWLPIAGVCVLTHAGIGQGTCLVWWTVWVDSSTGG
jgi:hypothetical protein